MTSNSEIIEVSSSSVEVLSPNSQEKNLTLKSSIVKSDLPKYWAKEYINNSINQVSNVKHKFFLTFLWFTGVRISEALNIRKKDIDFSNKTITIRWLKNRKYNYRNISVNNELLSLMQFYSASINLDDLLFDFSRQRAFQITQQYLGGSPHQLRHSFAINWLRCGGDVFLLSRHLGHRKIQTTMIYLDIVPVDIAKELDKVSFR